MLSPGHHSGMRKERYYFELRLENSLNKMAKMICKKEEISLSSLVDRAFRFIAPLYRKGNIPFKSRSKFFLRLNKENKFTRMIILQNDMHETVRNFAFAHRMSMAEVLRIALEVYLNFLVDGMPGIEEQIHYYNPAIPVIEHIITRLIPSLPPDICPEKYNTYIYT